LNVFFLQVADEAQRAGLEDGNDHFMVKARMAMLDKQFDLAEQILLDQGKIEEAMEMYQELHRL